MIIRFFLQSENTKKMVIKIMIRQKYEIFVKYQYAFIAQPLVLK